MVGFWRRTNYLTDTSKNDTIHFALVFCFFFFLVVLPHFVLCVLLGSYVALFMGLSFQKVASSQSIQSGISIGRKHTEKIKLDTEFCHVNWANTCLDFGHYLISDAIVPLWTWVSEFRHYCPILDRSFFFILLFILFFLCSDFTRIYQRWKQRMNSRSA